jgi:hypothetical protein
MTESMAWRLALVGLVSVVAVALVIGGGSIGAGVNAVSLSLWHFIQTAQAPARSDREGTIVSPATGETHESDLPAHGHETSARAEGSMSQAFTLVSAASEPWLPLATPTAGAARSGAGVPDSTPPTPAVSGPASTSPASPATHPDAGSSGSAQVQSAGTPGAGHDEATPTRKELGGALAELDQAIRRDFGNAEAFRQRALVYAARQETDKAIENWTKAIELATMKAGRMSDVELFMAYGSRAALYDVKHQFTREIADLTQMLESYRLKPEVAEALDEVWGAAPTRELLSSIYKQRAKASVLLGAYDKAMEDLGLAIELDRGRAADAYGERARIEQRLGQHERAVSDWRAALRLDPGMKDAKESLARLEAEAGARSSGRTRASPGLRASTRPLAAGTAGTAATP